MSVTCVGTFYVKSMGDDKKQPDKKGWLILAQKYEGTEGSFMAQAFEILTYWKTTKEGTPTALGAQLAKVAAGSLEDVQLIDVEYSYRRTSSGSGKDIKWWDNHNLVAIDRVVNTGQDVAEDDSVLPSTTETNPADLSPREVDPTSLLTGGDEA